MSLPAKQRMASVAIKIDTSGFVRAMNTLAEALALMTLPAWATRAPHHLPETPARSAMHAQYDQRRRARRRRNRR